MPPRMRPRVCKHVEGCLRGPTSSKVLEWRTRNAYTFLPRTRFVSMGPPRHKTRAWNTKRTFVSYVCCPTSSAFAITSTPSPSRRQGSPTLQRIIELSLSIIPVKFSPTSTDFFPSIFACLPAPSASLSWRNTCRPGCGQFWLEGRSLQRQCSHTHVEGYT